MNETEYISAKVPTHIKRALDAIVSYQRMQDGADIRRSALIREALLDFIEKEMDGNAETRKAVEEAIYAAHDDAS